MRSQVEAWVDGEYAMAQAAGERLPAAERTAIGRQLAEYTGVSELFVQQSNLRIDDGQVPAAGLQPLRRSYIRPRFGKLPTPTAKRPGGGRTARPAAAT